MIALNRLEPEPLQLASALALAGLLAPLAFGVVENVRRTATMAGILLGFSVAAKITALPLIPLLLLLPGWDTRKRAGWIALVSLIVFTLPAAHHYGMILSWITGMATHSGFYTDGPAGLPPVATLLSYGVKLCQNAPEFFVGLLIYAALAVFGPLSLRRLMAVSALVMAAQILMVIKQPETRYLVPAVAVFALANAGILAALLARRAAWSIAGLVAVMLAGLCYSAVSTAAWTRNNRAADVANRRIMEQASASGCAIVFYYEAPVKVYNLDFGNQYAGSRFRNALQRIYPKGFTYDWARHSFAFFGTPLSPAQLQAGLAPARCIYLVGSPLERFNKGFSFGIPSSSLTPVARSPSNDGLSLAVYRYNP